MTAHRLGPPLAATCVFALAIAAVPAGLAAPAPRGGVGNAYRTTVPAAVTIVLPLQTDCLHTQVLPVRVQLAQGVRLRRLTAVVAGTRVHIARGAGRIELRVPRRGSFTVSVTATAVRHGHVSRAGAAAGYRACAA